MSKATEKLAKQQAEEKREEFKKDIIHQIRQLDVENIYSDEKHAEAAEGILNLIQKEVSYTPNKIDEALEEFYNENSTMDMSEKMSNLRNAFMLSALDSIKEVNRKGTKMLERTETIFKQEEGMKQFNLLQRMYESQLKSAKVEGKTPEDVNNQWLKDIKESKGSMGDIVRNMHENKR